MIAKIMSIGLKGIEGYLVQVEVQTICAMRAFVIVGLPDASVKESKERVSTALHSFGHQLVDHKIIINLSPSEQKKNGPLFDLPIAVGILKSMGVITSEISNLTGFIGALSLDGSIQPVEGMLPAVLAAKKIGLTILYMPYSESLPEIEIDNFEIIYVSSLKDVVQHLSGQDILPVHTTKSTKEKKMMYDKDFTDIIGHQFAKRALEIAAAGEHHLFMVGPPGCGKSMLAETFPSILPPLTKEAQLEKISLYELAGMGYEDSGQSSIRTPHHSASSVSIIGGGQTPKPGEISLAHRGVLFLDEIAEFSKKTLDMLRQPIESGVVTISRARSIVKYPASFLLIGAMNPCPCGYLGSNSHYCTCSIKQVRSYQNRLSGPIRDRFDISLKIEPVILNKVDEVSNSETSETIRKRVIEARERQYERYGKELTNGRVSYDIITKTNEPKAKIQQILQQVSFKKKWSNRVQIKVLRLARTISDLKGENQMTEEALWEAMTLSRSQDYFLECGKRQGRK